MLFNRPTPNTPEQMTAIKSMLSFIIDLIQAGGRSLSDGKITMSDLWNLRGMLRSSWDLARNVQDFDAEVWRLTSDDRTELEAHITQKMSGAVFDLGNVLEPALKFIVHLLQGAKLFHHEDK